MPETPPPTSSDIGDLVGSVTDEFSDRETRDAWRDDLYWGETPIEHPAHIDFEPVHMNLGTAVVQNFIGILDDYPTVRAHTTSLKDKEVSRTTKVEDYLNPLWAALEDDSDQDTFHLVKEDVIRLGRGNDELLYAPHFRSDRAPGYPARRSDESEMAWKGRRDGWAQSQRLPLVWRHLPARGTFLWHDDDGVSEALVVEERRVGDLLRRYPGGLSKLRDRRFRHTDHVFCLRHWTREWCTTWVSHARTFGTEQNVTSADLTGPRGIRTGSSGLFGLKVMDGEVADQYPNLYGYVPITETSGVTTSDTRSGRRQISIMDHMLPLCLYLDRLVSQKASMVRTWAWPTPVLKNLGINGQLIGEVPKLADDGRPIPVEVEPGFMLTLLPGEDITWLIAPAAGVDVDEQIGLIMRQADMLGIPSAIFDASSVNSSNGYLYNSILNATRARWSMIPRHIKRAHRQRCYGALRMVELYGEPLSVYREGDGKTTASEWFTIAPQDVKDAYYQLDVHFEDHLPMDDAADVQMFLQVTADGPNGPGMDMNTGRERFLRDNSPERTEARIRLQRWKLRPEVDAFLTAKAMEQAGYLLDAEEQGTPEELMALASQGGAPPGLQQLMAPRGGNGNVPPMTGGVTGAPGVPPQPGLNQPLTPAPTNLGAPPANTGVKSPKNQYRGRPVKQGGRASGQKRRPPSQPRPAGP